MRTYNAGAIKPPSSHRQRPQAVSLARHGSDGGTRPKKKPARFASGLCHLGQVQKLSVAIAP